jgi:hypothetical protein
MTEEQAVMLAAEVAKREGWPWRPPIQATLRKRSLFSRQKYWEIRSNVAMRGMNVTVSIDDATGIVEGAGFLPR